MFGEKFYFGVFFKLNYAFIYNEVIKVIMAPRDEKGISLVF